MERPAPPKSDSKTGTVRADASVESALNASEMTYDAERNGPVGPEAAGKKTAAAKTTNTVPVGQVSPIGTHKNKIPVAKNMPAGNGR